MKKPTKEVLCYLYTECNLTDKVIGSQYEVSDVTVSNWRRLYGIKTKSQLARAGKGFEFEQLSSADLRSLYTTMGAQAIAKRYGVSKPTVRARLRKLGIRPISKTERATSNIDLTKEQQEALIGSLLGDGHLLSRGCFKVTHYQGQLAYLRHLCEVLKPLSLPLYYEEKEMENGRLTTAFGFRTSQHTWLRSLRSTFYPQGEKIYPKMVLSELSPRSLAYWYFDDGSLDSGLPSFAVGAISDSQMSLLLEAIAQRFDLNLYEAHPSGSCRILRVKGKSVERFFGLVVPHTPPDLVYKVPPKYWPSGTTPNRPTKTKDPQLLPTHLVQEAKGWSGLAVDGKEEVLEAFVNYWSEVGFPYHTPRPEELESLHNLEPRMVIRNGEIRVRQTGQSICQGLCRSIWNGHSYGSVSPLTLFHNEEHLRSMLRFILSSGEVPNQARLRGALRYWRRNGVYNFRPSAAKALVDKYCPPGGVIMDPCAGYGGRLLGSILSSAKPLYIGCEPSSNTYQGLCALHRWVSDYVPEVRDQVQLHNGPAEEYAFPSVDMVLTSPPYWKREVYAEEDTQSAIRYTTYESWLTNFWSAVISKSVQSLKPNGVLVLNVDDFKLHGRHYSLIEDTVRLVAEQGLGAPERLTYLMPGGGRTTPQTEAVLCWYKGATTSQGRIGSLSLPKCSSCGSTCSISALDQGVCGKCRVVPIKCWCGVEFQPRRKNHVFHSEVCYARHKRLEARKLNPAKTSRTFTCTVCGHPWETSKKGNFKRCPACARALEAKAREKVCAYCKAVFVDTSAKNGMRYCCPTHRNKAKVLRNKNRVVK